MRYLLAILLTCRIAYGQIPTGNLIGHWTGGINADSTLTVGTYSIKLYNVDFDTALDYIPFKTKATMKLVSNASNVDTGFWNYYIPPCIVPENVDYRNKTYFKISSPTYDSVNREILPYRITEIAIYSVANTGSDSTTLAVYFNVPQKAASAKWCDYTFGNDLTGNGTFALPYKTITKALTVSTDTIYMKSGRYVEGTGLTMFKKATLIGVGRVESISTGTSYQLRSNTGDKEVIRMMCEKDNYSTFLYVYGPTVTKAKLKRCYIESSFNAGNFPIYLDDIVNRETDFYIDQCVIISLYVVTTTSGYNRFANDDTVKNSYLSTHIIFDGQNQYLAYNKIVNNGTTSNTRPSLVLYTGVKFYYNDFVVKKGMIHNLALTTTTMHTSDLYRNNITILDAVLANQKWFYTFSDSACSNFYYNNFDVYPTRYTGINNVIDIGKGRLCSFKHNTIDIKTQIASGNVYPLYTPATLVKVDTVAYNKILGYFSTGLYIGSEAPGGNVANNGYIVGNYISSQKGKDSLSSNVHGLLLTNSVNALIAYNYVEYCGAGLVYKTSAKSSSNNGICYNVIYRCGDALYCRGCKDVNIFNNTIYNDGYKYPFGVKSAIIVDKNTANDSNWISSNCKIFNNIVYQKNHDAGYYPYRIDTIALARNTIIEKDMYYGSDTLIMTNTSNYYTYAAAVDSGWASSLLNQNPLFTNFIPANTNAINKGKVHTQIIDGLNTSTVFATNTIVTKPQAASTWSLGAYVLDAIRRASSGGGLGIGIGIMIK